MSCRFIPYDSVRHPGPRPDRSGSSKDPPRDPAAGSRLLFCWLAGWLAGWLEPTQTAQQGKLETCEGGVSYRVIPYDSVRGAQVLSCAHHDV